MQLKPHRPARTAIKVALFFSPLVVAIFLPFRSFAPYSLYFG